MLNRQIGYTVFGSLFREKEVYQGLGQWHTLKAGLHVGGCGTMNRSHGSIGHESWVIYDGS